MLYLPETLTYAVFVYFYLCICICVFASQTTGNIVFEVLVSLPFRKYMVCMVQNLAQLRKVEMSRTDGHVKLVQYTAEAETGIP